MGRAGEGDRVRSRSECLSGGIDTRRITGRYLWRIDHMVVERAPVRGEAEVGEQPLGVRCEGYPGTCVHRIEADGPHRITVGVGGLLDQFLERYRRGAGPFEYEGIRAGCSRGVLVSSGEAEVCRYPVTRQQQSRFIHPGPEPSAGCGPDRCQVDPDMSIGMPVAVGCSESPGSLGIVSTGVRRCAGVVLFGTRSRRYGDAVSRVVDDGVVGAEDGPFGIGVQVGFDGRNEEYPSPSAGIVGLGEIPVVSP